MPLSSVSSWTAEQVSLWIRGLDDALVQYEDKIKEQEINGTKLLSISRQDLEKLEVVKVGHQELFLESVQLLHRLPKEENTEESLKTLVNSYAENVKSVLTAVVNQSNSENEEGPLPVAVLHVLPSVTSNAKSLVTLLNRYPYSIVKRCNQLREQLCKKTEFIIKQAEKNSSVALKELSDKLKELEDDCEKFLSEAEEKVIFQCFSVETANLNTEGHTTGLSPASMSEKIDIGDEILQISDQVVVGWQQDKVAELLKSQPSSFQIMVKKLPGERITESSETTVNGVHEQEESGEANTVETSSVHENEENKEVLEQKKQNGDIAEDGRVQKEEQADREQSNPSEEILNGTEEEKPAEQFKDKTNEETIEISEQVISQEVKEETKETAATETKAEAQEEKKESDEATKEESSEITKDESEVTVVTPSEQTKEVSEKETVVEQEVQPENKEEEVAVKEEASNLADTKEQEQLAIAEAKKETAGEELKEEKEKLEESETKNTDTEEKAEPTSPDQSSKSSEVDKTGSSKTKWYVDSDGEPVDEAECYSTTIVGGVPHKVPITSSSPKAAPKNAKKKSKQDTPEHQHGKFKLPFGSLFGKKKSKSASSPESSAADTADGKQDNETNGDPLEDKGQSQTPSHEPAVKAEQAEKPMTEEKPTAAEETSKEAEEPAKPVEEPAKSAEEPAKPAEEPAKPAEEPAKPAEEQAKPVEEPAKPAEEPAKPAEEPVKPAEEPEKPVEEPAKTAEEPAKTAEEPATAAEESTETAEEPAKRAEEPAEPAKELVKSDEEAARPDEEPAKPAEELAESAREPAKPDEPAEPTKEPIKPTEELAKEPAKPGEVAEDPIKTAEETVESAKENSHPDEKAAEEPAKSTEEPAKSNEEPAKLDEEPAKLVEEPAKSDEVQAKPVETKASTKEEQTAVDSPSEKHEHHQSKFKKVWGSLFKSKRSKSVDKEHPDDKLDSSKSPEATGNISTAEDGQPVTQQTEPESVATVTVTPQEAEPKSSEQTTGDTAASTEAPKEPENTDQKKETTVEREEADSKVVVVAEKTEKKTEEVFEKGEASTTEKEPSGAVSINGSSSDKLKESLTATAEEEKPEKSEVEVQGNEISTASPPLSESEVAQDEDSVPREHIRQRDPSTAGSHSPKAPPRMNMRISYAEKTKEGTLEVEVHGEVVRRSADEKKKRGPAENRISCVELGEVDHKGWLTKKSSGGLLAHWSWKRKWMVLKDRKLYYYKTSFDVAAGGVIHLDGAVISLAPEIKKPLCFKVEQSQIKTGKMYFIADNQEDLDSWMKVLNASAKGEVIVKPSPSNVVRLDVGHHDHRRRTGSTGIRPQRASSILAVGATNQDFLHEENKQKPRRASIGSDPKDTSELSSTNAQDKTREPDAKLSDITGQISNQPTVLVEPSSPTAEPEEGASQSDVQVKTTAEENKNDTKTEKEQKGETKELQEERKEAETTQEQKDQTQENDKDSLELQKKDTSETAAVVNTEPPVAVAEIAVVNTEPAVSVEVEQDSKSESTPSTEPTKDVEAESVPAPEPVSEPTSPKEADEVDKTLSESPADTTDGAPQLEIKQEENKNQTEDVSNEVETVSERETKPEDPDLPPTTVIGVQEEPVDEKKDQEALDGTEEEVVSGDLCKESAQSPSRSNTAESQTSAKTPSTKNATSSKSPNATKWYYVLDTNDNTWTVNKLLDDEMKSLYRSIKNAKISIWGKRVLDPPERLRAMTSAQTSCEDQQILKLNALQRALKDKEHEEKAVEELISHGVNRQSVTDWKEKYPHLSGYVEESEELPQEHPQSDVPNGEAPQPEKVEDQAPQPEKVEDQAPQPEKVEDQAPQPEKVEDQAPQPEKVEDQALQPDDIKDQAPKPETDTDQEPRTDINQAAQSEKDDNASQADDVNGQAPKPETNTDQEPRTDVSQAAQTEKVDDASRIDDVSGQASQQGQDAESNAEDTHL